MTYPAGQTVPPPEGTQPTPDAGAAKPEQQNTIQFPTGKEILDREKVEEKRQAFLSLVPEQYKGKEYIQNILKTDDPQTEFFKFTDNAHSMTGRTVSEFKMPDENTPEDQRKEFYKKLGVPDSIESYTLDTVEWAPEEKEAGEAVVQNRDPRILKQVAEAAQKAGVTDKQLKIINGAFEKAVVSVYKDGIIQQVKKQANNKTIDESFSTETKRLYGNQAEQVLANGKKMLEESVPPSIHEKLKSLDNDAILVLSAAMDSFHRKYVREGSFTGVSSSTTQAPARTIDDLSTERRAIYASEAWNNPGSPDHKDAKRRERANDNEARRIQGLPLLPSL